jgi:hypothetical protein
MASTNTSKPQALAAPIRATLIGCDRCEAEGHTVRAYAPVPAMCRELVAAVYDPATPLEAYRSEAAGRSDARHWGSMLCLKVRAIGEGAQYTVKDHNRGTPRLQRYQKPALGVATAAPIAPSALGVS